MLLSGLLDLSVSDHTIARTILPISQVTLCPHQNAAICMHSSPFSFWFPLCAGVLEWLLIWKAEADKKTVSVAVHYLVPPLKRLSLVRFPMVLRINLDFLTFEAFRYLVWLHACGWFVVLWESFVVPSLQKAKFTDLGVAQDQKFKHLNLLILHRHKRAIIYHI